MRINILGVIPARGGSKSIPRKNLVPLVGRPLIAYTIDAASKSRLLTQVILSTDDPEIGTVGRSLGVEVPFMRPSHLAADDTPMVDVLRHAAAWCAENGAAPDAIVVLQPTSPLRGPQHIDAAIELMQSTSADTVVSVVVVPHQYSPESIMQIVDHRLIPYLDAPLKLRRQDKSQLFARNGPAVLVVRRELVEEGRLYGESVVPYIMTRRESVDIDDWEDHALAEFWLNKRPEQ